MAKLVSPLSRRINSGPCQTPSDDISYCLRPVEACDRCPTTEKHIPVSGWGSCVSQIVGDGFPDITGQWQFAMAPALAKHCNQSRLPVQIFQSKPDDLARTQSQSRE
jgi:hypothetical protein